MACSILIVAVLVADPFIGKHEEARLAALLDGHLLRRPRVRKPRSWPKLSLDWGPKPTASLFSKPWRLPPCGRTSEEGSLKPAEG